MPSCIGPPWFLELMEWHMPYINWLWLHFPRNWIDFSLSSQQSLGSTPFISPWTSNLINNWVLGGINIYWFVLTATNKAVFTMKKKSALDSKIGGWEIFAGLLFLKLLIYFWLFWVFVAACRLSLVVVSGGYALIVERGLLVMVGSLAVEHRL